MTSHNAIAGVRSHDSRLDLCLGTGKQLAKFFQPSVDVPRLLTPRCGNRRRKRSFCHGDRHVLGSQKLYRIAEKRRDVLAGFQREDNAAQDVGRFERPRDEQEVTGRIAHEFPRNTAGERSVSVFELESTRDQKLVIVILRRGDDCL